MNILYHSNGSDSTQIPNRLSNLFLKVKLKFTIRIYDPTLRHGEKIVTKVGPIVYVMVKYPKGFVRS
jgi:hypothetical protein